MMVFGHPESMENQGFEMVSVRRNLHRAPHFHSVDLPFALFPFAFLTFSSSLLPSPLPPLSSPPLHFSRFWIKRFAPGSQRRPRSPEKKKRNPLRPFLGPWPTMSPDVAKALLDTKMLAKMKGSRPWKSSFRTKLPSKYEVSAGHDF